MDPETFVLSTFRNLLVPDKEYITPLPPELQKWYCYMQTTGHIILCVLKDDYVEERDLRNHLIPIPVKSALRHYKVKRGHIVVDLDYSPERGLIVYDGDIEF
ncbi:MAG: hypothetical protein COB67_02850 [SAR324 cluster bacterium]|uniref:Uncharacterized protein n=1 Tax=SAR324 cluster bacterium TaxID=2024889 RepID=A0A2A4TAM7_9DELT|nr:MAG: hypothetical protein COB67_02850 [SAR324 cluster bacterium]